MKKILMMLLALVMSFAVFGACSNKAGDWDYIEKQGKLIIGFDPHFPPMGYFQNSGETDASKAIGFDIDVAKEMAEILNIEVQFKSIDWSKKESELKSKNIDLIWNGYTMTPSRAANHLFSVPYMKNTQAIVIRSADASKYTDKASLAGAKVGYQTDSSAQDAVKADEVLKNNSQLNSKDYGTALNELKLKNTECLVMDSVSAAYYINLEDNKGTFTLLDFNLGEEVYGIGIRQCASLTLYKINSALYQLRDSGKLNEIAQKHGLLDELLLKKSA